MFSITAIFFLASIHVTWTLDINLRTEQVVEIQGYRAVEYSLTTSDGYILSLVQVINPKISENETLDKDPILFLHGSLTTANFFIALAKKPRPRNLVNAIGPDADLDALKELFKGDPTAKSLVYAASNMGHPVWLLNRRGTQFSLSHIDPKRQAFFRMTNSSEQLLNLGSFSNVDPSLDFLKFFSRLVFASADLYNPKYWNFSLDEQAIFDFPAAIDFVLEKTGRTKLATVSHSAGGAITLMALSLEPKLARKISKAILWAPALYLGHAKFTPLLQLSKVAIMKALAFVSGPDIPPAVSVVVKQFLMILCDTFLGRTKICPAILSSFFGPQKTQLILKSYITGLLPDINSAREISQLFHSIVYGRMYKFDYQNKVANQAAYGTDFPPIYNVSRIPSENLYVWSAAQDYLVTAIDIEQVSRDISLPPDQFIMVDEPEILFNHLAYGAHKKLAELVILPSLCQIQSRPGC